MHWSFFMNARSDTTDSTKAGDVAHCDSARHAYDLRWYRNVESVRGQSQFSETFYTEYRLNIG